MAPSVPFLCIGRLQPAGDPPVPRTAEHLHPRKPSLPALRELRAKLKQYPADHHIWYIEGIVERIVGEEPGSW